jgi:hypothetical protein
VGAARTRAARPRWRASCAWSPPPSVLGDVCRPRLRAARGRGS